MPLLLVCHQHLKRTFANPSPFILYNRKLIDLHSMKVRRMRATVVTAMLR